MHAGTGQCLSSDVIGMLLIALTSVRRDYSEQAAATLNSVITRLQ